MSLPLNVKPDGTPDGAAGVADAAFAVVGAADEGPGVVGFGVPVVPVGCAPGLPVALVPTVLVVSGTIVGFESTNGAPGVAPVVTHPVIVTVVPVRRPGVAGAWPASTAVMHPAVMIENS